MTGLELPPDNPADLAQTIATESIGFEFPDRDDMSEYAVLDQLETEADALNFKDERFFVNTFRALSIPTTWDDGEEVRYLDFSKKLFFAGDFRGFSKVIVGRIIGYSSIRAYCLTFENVTLLPYSDELPKDHIFHVPALAVDSMNQMN